MKIRQHRGGLLESMQTMEHIEPTMNAIKTHVANCMQSMDFETVTLEYCGYDNRIDWDCSYVIVDGHVFGMIDGKPIV